MGEKKNVKDDSRSKMT